MALQPCPQCQTSSAYVHDFQKLGPTAADLAQTVQEVKFFFGNFEICVGKKTIHIVPVL